MGEYNTDEHPFLLYDLANVHENDHTRVLMSILRYNNNQFLPSFIKVIGAPEITPEIESIQKQPTGQVKAIGKSGTGYIDMFFEYSSLNNTQERVIVENKIYGACDTPRQLARYIATILEVKDFDNWYKGWNDNNNESSIDNNIHVVYLTSDGTKEPNTGQKNQEVSIPDALKQKVNYYPINYLEHIIPWLENDVLPNMPYSDEGIAIAGIRQYIASLKTEFCSKGSSSAIKEFESNNIGDSERYRTLMEVMSLIKSLIDTKQQKKKTDIIYQLEKEGIAIEDIPIQALVKDLRAEATGIFSNDGAELGRDWKLYFTPSFICLYKQSWADLDTRKYSIPSIYLLAFTNNFFSKNIIKWRIQVDHLDYKHAVENEQYKPFKLGNHDMTAYYDIPDMRLTIEEIDKPESRKKYYKNLIERLKDYVSKIDEVAEEVRTNHLKENYFQEEFLKGLAPKLSPDNKNHHNLFNSDETTI